ncbi:MAG: hypothetical protein AAF542_06455 [Pseudomonadota bacterium]
MEDLSSLIRSTRRDSHIRAVGETIACMIVAGYVVYYLPQAAPYGAVYFGLLIVFFACGTVSAIVCSHILRNKTIQDHPVSEKKFWEQEISRQSRLLHTVPYWYLPLLMIGVVLTLTPLIQQDPTKYVVSIVVIVLVSIWIIHINRKEAARIENNLASTIDAATDA